VPKQSRFVKPESIRLPLYGAALDDPECEWIEVKRQINYGDQQKMAAALIDGIDIPAEAIGDESARSKFKETLRLKLDIETDGPYKILVWGLDWNLEDGDGGVVEFCLDAITNLDIATAAEINRAIDAHATSVGIRRGKAKRGSRGLKLKS